MPSERDELSDDLQLLEREDARASRPAGPPTPSQARMAIVLLLLAVVVLGVVLFSALALPPPTSPDTRLQLTIVAAETRVAPPAGTGTPIR